MFKEPPGITYAKSVEELGITPVYPPREDIQVGDVWAVEVHTFDERLSARTAFIGTRDMQNEVDDYLVSRHVPKSTEPTTGLLINGLPQIEVNSGISVGVSGQPKGLMASFGFAAARTLKMSLQFGDVVSYEVPIPVGMESLLDFCTRLHPERCRERALTTYINQRYQLGRQDQNRVVSAGSMMVTKVYMAKRIIFTFNDAQLAAASAMAVGEGGEKNAPPTITQQQLDQAIAKNNPELLNAMNSTIATVQTSANAGGPGAITLAAVSSSSVSFQQVFARHVVIGYEGVSRAGDVDVNRR